ncbi:MAG: 4Fe-4S dicluster domain-containing protein [candidate division NC10 bacterium]|nr:4Fe-4S dicluster domain-containing protein [candidate division NC10 bacterium]
MRILTAHELEGFLRSLEGEYDVRAPITLPDGTRTLGRMEEGPLAMEGGPLPLKPTSVFFPQHETELEYEQGMVLMQAPLSKPLCLVGLTAQDADCLWFVDEFFQANYQDDIYFNKRNGALIVVVSGRCGREGEFLKIAGGKCDMELICEGEAFILAPYTQTGREVSARMGPGKEVTQDRLAALQRESSALGKEGEELLRRASQILREDRVPEEFWLEISRRCIACTACNLFCPTCTCFEVYDRRSGRRIERQRLWDSCQLDGFMREASGHNPMGSEALRTRRRIHHKLAADVVRWGRISCFLCGRCDQMCPTGIGIQAVSQQIVKRYGR